jgi:surface polysaccharide O-acyltransferase-like enzyme
VTAPAPILWISGLRVAAAVAVVCLHVSAQVVRGARPGSAAWWIGNAFDAAVRWSVPVFVMVSGALLLAPDAREPWTRFLARRAARLLPAVAFWSAFYLALRALLGWPLTLEGVADALYHGRPEHHLWYLYMLLGLALATPALRALVARSSEAQRWALVAACFTASAAYHAASVFAGAPRLDSVLTMWLPYVGYYLCGYQLRGRAGEAVPTGVLLALWIAAVAATALGTGALVSAHGTGARGLYLYGNPTPGVLISSLAAFLIGRRAFAALDPNAAPARALLRLAPLSLGLYVLHPLVLTALERAAGVDALRTGGWLGVPLMVLLASALSLALARALMTVPVLRRTLA